jgi:hypothetical protein
MLLSPTTTRTRRMRNLKRKMDQVRILRSQGLVGPNTLVMGMTGMMMRWKEEEGTVGVMKEKEEEKVEKEIEGDFK